MPGVTSLKWPLYNILRHWWVRSHYCLVSASLSDSGTLRVPDSRILWIGEARISLNFGSHKKAITNVYSVFNDKSAAETTVPICESLEAVSLYTKNQHRKKQRNFYYLFVLRFLLIEMIRGHTLDAVNCPPQCKFSQTKRSKMKNSLHQSSIVLV